MKISKGAFNKLKAKQDRSPEQIIEAVETVLEGVTVQDEQYQAIKSLINTPETMKLKEFFEIEDFVNAHKMRFLLINMFNEAEES